MQTLLRDFVVELAAAAPLPDPIVEFGAMQVEPDQPGDLRPLFPGRDYLGTDIRPGPGVDRVEDVCDLSFGDGEVGTALCLETLEHCQDPVRACRELHRVVADGGVCVITSVLMFGIHAYPNDYWRFTPEAFRLLLQDFDDVWATGIGNPDMPMQILGVGAKGRSLGLSMDSFPSLQAAQRTWDTADGRVRIGPLIHPPGEVVRALGRDLPRVARQRAGRALAARAPGAYRLAKRALGR
ncbi:MAG TPA: methyltransferase domain-containing protein [Thermoleophilaceae bacterium]|nr:methyltransferase domain-containing protein [Thermoleophilaceae bacterium]